MRNLYWPTNKAHRIPGFYAAAKECAAKGFPGFAAFNEECAMYLESCLRKEARQLEREETSTRRSRKEYNARDHRND